MRTFPTETKNAVFAILSVEQTAFDHKFACQCRSIIRPAYVPRVFFQPLVYSKDHNIRTPPLTFRTYQILPHTNSYVHCLYSYLDLLQQLLGYQGGFENLGYPRAPWGGEGLESCEDSESSCEYGVGSGRYGRLGGEYDYYGP